VACGSVDGGLAIERGVSGVGREEQVVEVDKCSEEDEGLGHEGEL
jgi:hypothetical protein